MDIPWVVAKSLPAELIPTLSTVHVGSAFKLNNTDTTVRTRLSSDNFLNIVEEVRVKGHQVLKFKRQPLAQRIKCRVRPFIFTLFTLQ